VRAALLAVAALAALAVSACGYPDPYATSGQVANESPAPVPTPCPTPGGDVFNAGAGLPVVPYPDGLKYVDLKVGTGAAAVSGESVTVQYTGWLSASPCFPFDSSRVASRTAFNFQLGVGSVIPGWDEGVPGMKVGGSRKLLIPSDLAYGANGSTPDQTTGAQTIPPNATLVFDIELLKVAPGPKPSPTPKPTPSPSPSPTSSPSPTPT
jgi:FKBP-type peptidyl-prolyl cis-trans isomerase